MSNLALLPNSPQPPPSVLRPAPLLNRTKLLALLPGLIVAASLTACGPTVQVALPSEPININLNVKIQHEILIKVDKQLDALFSDSSGLF